MQITITGPSGCGKTTVAIELAKFLKQCGCNVTLHGADQQVTEHLREQAINAPALRHIRFCFPIAIVDSFEEADEGYLKQIVIQEMREQWKSSGLKDSEEGILRECLSALDRKDRSFWGCKNSVSAAIGTRCNSAMNRLRKAGYLIKASSDRDGQSRFVRYAATPLACEALSFTKREKKRAMANQFIES